MSRRFDAAEAWLARKRLGNVHDTSACYWCRPESAQERRSRFSRNPNDASNLHPAYKSRWTKVGVRTKRTESRSKCQQSAKHFANIYNAGLGKEVLTAASVLRKLSREIVRPVEAEVEKQIVMRARLTDQPPNLYSLKLTGKGLLRIVKKLLKEVNQ